MRNEHQAILLVRRLWDSVYRQQHHRTPTADTGVERQPRRQFGSMVYCVD